MRGVSLLVVSLLGTTAHSPDRDSLRGQLHPASTYSSDQLRARPTLIGSKVTCKGGTASSLRTIDVRTWEEGISSARVSLAELLTLAHMINATLIEPCMHDGHLIACDGNCGRASKGRCDADATADVNLDEFAVVAGEAPVRVKLSELFDLHALQKIAPIVPSEVAQEKQRTDEEKRTVCMSNGDLQSCEGMGLKQYYGVSVEELACGSAERLEVFSYRKGAITGLDAGLVWQAEHTIDFAKSAYAAADDLAGLMGLPEKYVAYHWRSEEHEEHYVECAQHLIESRDTLLKKSPKSNHATLLISDLMSDQSIAWYGKRRKGHREDGEKALKQLFDAGFVKIDSFVTAALARLKLRRTRRLANSSELHVSADETPSPALLSRTTDAELDRIFNKRMLALTLASQSPQYRDMGEVSVWDLILAKRADTLSTCTACFYDEQGRDRVKVCDKCAWQGSFAAFIAQLREGSAGTTNTCWP